MKRIISKTISIIVAATIMCDRATWGLTLRNHNEIGGFMPETAPTK